MTAIEDLRQELETAQLAKLEADQRLRKALDRELDLVAERQAALEEADRIGATCDQLRQELAALRRET